MSTDSTSSSSLALLVPTPSTSTNVVGEAILASGEDTHSDSPPSVPWRTGADTQLPRAAIAYIGHTNWRAHHQPEGDRRRVRRRIRRKRLIVNEIGVSRDFFLIIALCFVLACLLIVVLRPIALEILWHIDDSY
ncbi:hypothetical protein B0H17DRAFT_1194807 [Mycena rosella]|uniref:Uncharacterized protein n=1 Tax=Mycena rosella TaxID=1033263 RepID=A0AAD7E062_MYCRO|nr:hypothetical protein B0H17DRAFT_1194807 [Mycena rosella]